MSSLQPIVVPHRIQDRTDAELEAAARNAVEWIVEKLVGREASPGRP